MTIRLKPEVVVITLTNLHHEVGHDLILGCWAAMIRDVAEQQRTATRK